MLLESLARITGLGALYTIFLVAPFILVWLVLMTYTIPRDLAQRYLKPPHVTSGELVFFGHFPFSCLKFIVIARAITLPKSMPFRKMENIRQHIPGWYRWTAIAWFVSLFFTFFLFLFLTAIALAIPYFYPEVAASLKGDVS
jgi:hypothetical protein